LILTPFKLILLCLAPKSVSMLPSRVYLIARPPLLFFNTVITELFTIFDVLITVMFPAVVPCPVDSAAEPRDAPR
jgi:hypothetical protein